MGAYLVALAFAQVDRHPSEGPYFEVGIVGEIADSYPAEQALEEQVGPLAQQQVAPEAYSGLQPAVVRVLE